jgi:hypothetical protein
MENVSITGDTTIDIQLEGIPVSGNVLGPDGLPLEDAGVEAGYAARIRTRIDGSYRLYVPSGTYRIWFRPPHPFYIFPRVTDPIAITGPVSIDCDLRGVEWVGTVRRLGTGDPAPGVILIVTQVGDEFERGAAIESGPQGGFRFVLEPNHSYGLRVYDPVAGEYSTPVQDVAAIADTTFEILIP